MYDKKNFTVSVDLLLGWLIAISLLVCFVTCKVSLAIGTLQKKVSLLEDRDIELDAIKQECLKSILKIPKGD